MQRRWLGAMMLATTMVAGLLQTASPAAARQKAYEIERVDYVVKTKWGHIFVQVAHPVDSKGKIVTGPAIFTYSPYSILGAPPNYRRNSDASNWVPRGYHRVWADVVGTGNSGGCYDYGGKREKETGAALVEWIAKQKWSTGKVGMIGGSYEGTTATATAVMNPPHLTTIVPEAAIVRWYDYAFTGGIRYNLNNENPSDEGLDTPLGFDFGFAIPPPLDPAGENWADRLQETTTPCEEVDHTEHGYDMTPDYDKFWEERDYLRDAGKIDIPVLVAANWGDWNVKQEESWLLYHALKNAPKKVLYMGTRWAGHGTPGGDYGSRVNDWMDHYLMGKDNGIEDLPTLVSQVSTNTDNGDFYEGKLPKTRNVALTLQETPKTSPDDYQWKLLPMAPQITGPEATPATFPSEGANTESHANHHARFNHDWFWFESPPLKKDVRLFGSPQVKVWSTVNRNWVTLSATVVDFDHECHIMEAGQHVGPKPECTPQALYSVTRGFLDSRYRDSLAKQKAIEPGKSFGMTIVEKPQDYIFKKGHSIALNISGEIVEWMVPKLPYDCAGVGCEMVVIDWSKGQSKLVLPLVGAPKNPMDLFDMVGHHH